MAEGDRLFTPDIRWLSIYSYNSNLYTTGGLVSDMLSTYQNCKLSGTTTFEKVRATWEKWSRSLPVEQEMRIEVGNVVDPSLPSLAAIYLNTGPGPYRVIYNSGATHFVAFVWIESVSEDAPGDAMASAITLLIEGQPMPYSL